LRTTLNRINSSITLLVVSGALDMSTSDRIRSLLNDVVNSGCRFLVMNCRDVSALDSAGLQGLVQAAARLSGCGGKVFLVQPSAAVTKTLELTNSTGKFSVVKNEGEAYKAAGL